MWMEIKGKLKGFIYLTVLGEVKGSPDELMNITFLRNSVFLPVIRVKNVIWHKAMTKHWNSKNLRM